MNRTIAAVTALLTGLLVSVAPPTHASTDRTAVAPSCGTGSWTAGTVDICAGELVYRDYIYDDHGASLAALPDDRAEGLYDALRVPTDGYGDLVTAGVVELADLTGERDNTGDLVSLRMRIDGGRLHATAELNTVFDDSDAMVIVGIDADNDAGTASGPVWPGGVVANPFQLVPTDQPLANQGLDEFIVLDDVDPDTNIATGSIPTPPGATWRLQAVVARPIAPFPNPVVTNVAFRGVDERGHWWENAQAKALALNDISSMSYTVSVADLTSGVTQIQEVEPGLVRQRVYISEYPIGEGLRPGDGVLAKPLQFAGNIDFLGRYQPYGLVVPPGDGPHGIQFVLHGLGENHSALLSDPAGGQNPPPIASKMGIPFDRIVVVALGRGPAGFYRAGAHRDFLDVLADLQATYPVDDERVFGGGMSMGGYGAYRMAVLHPDLFATAVTWVGATGSTLAGTPLEGQDTILGSDAFISEMVSNLRHVPLGALYSGADELVHVNEALALRESLAEHQIPSALWLHPVATHSTFAAIQDYGKEMQWAKDHVRVTDPARVTYRTDQDFYVPELDLAPDGAYWIDDIVPAGAGYADVDAVSFGCGIGDPTTEQTSATGTDPVPWEAQLITEVGVTERAAANRLDLTLSNVRSLTVTVGDANAPAGQRQACLSADPIIYNIETDGPVEITFTDGRRLALDAGVHEGEVAATATASPTGDSATAPGSSGTLPATGTNTFGPLAAALMALGLALAGRRLATR